MRILATKRPEIVGRHTSHFTRLVLIVARELGFEYSFTPVFDLMSLDSADFGSHPGLKLPVLRVGNDVVYGSIHICRRIASLQGRTGDIVWPFQAANDISINNFDEIVMQAMATQVTVVIADQIARVKPNNILSVKSAAGLNGMLSWIDANINRYVHRLPKGMISLSEIATFCLVEHIIYRKTVRLSGFPNLLNFTSDFGSRRSAEVTKYRLDQEAALNRTE